MRERMIEANDATLCTEAAGDPGDPPILLMMGMSASMLWWEEAFCRRLADAGRFVIRYDHRDTGRSRTYKPGHPEYTSSDLVADAVTVLDGYDIAAAHIVGMSMGGGLAQLLVLDSPDRVVSLVLMSTSPAVPGERDLPGIDASVGRFLATAQVDWADEASMRDYLVDYWRVLWGAERTFDERHILDLVQRDVERANDPAAAPNHGLVDDRRVGGARAPAFDYRADARHPRHRRPHVPARARRGAGRRDPRRTVAGARRRRALCRPGRLGSRHRRDPGPHARGRGTNPLTVAPAGAVRT